MEAGYLQWEATESITWVDKLLPLGMSCWRKDAEIIQSRSGIGVNAIPAHICRQCKLLLGDYSQ